MFAVDPPRRRSRLAFIASHPIQYVAPLYQRLAKRDDLAVKVFFTWHAGERAVADRGFGQPVAWDIPITQGYDFEQITNVAADPGTHHFFGLRNPGLVDRITAWQPDAVVVNGWAWLSHLQALAALHRRGTRTLFRGDSHLLDGPPEGPRGWLKQAALRRVFAWPDAFLVVGSANRAYYQAFGVARRRLHPCPHSIDVGRFAAPADELERQAAEWRLRLGIAPERMVALFAGKFERKKRPVELMRVVQRLHKSDIVLVLVGGGELKEEIDAIAAADPDRFRVIPFQNQNRMPVVYRLGDLFVLPSAHGETWGLAVNEALACGRPALVSDRVGCAADLIDADCGGIFRWDDLDGLAEAMNHLLDDRGRLAAMRAAAATRARAFDIAATETGLVAALADAGA
jgi:glycosyltransferase involved in cell wall biosynthesis